MIKNLSVVLIILFGVFIMTTVCHAAESQEQQYTVGVGDELSISVMGHDNLKTVATVAADGTISFPYLGTIYVKGMSVSEIEKEMSKRLASGYIKYPVVAITLTTAKSKKFFVYGEVRTSGKYILEDDMTVIKAISGAGGITPDGLYGSVKLRRKQKGSNGYKEINIDISNTKGNSANGDTPIEPEDIVIVERSKNFFVYGEVIKPGKFTLEEGTTVLKAISLAGGFAKYGSLDKVKILRTIPGKTDYKDIKVDMKGAVKGEVGKDIKLEPEDIVVVLEGIL